MAAPSFTDVNKKLKEGMASRQAAPAAEPVQAAPEAAPEAEGPSTGAQVAGGLAEALLTLLPQGAALATGGASALEKQRALEKEASSRQDEINKRAQQLAAEAQKLTLEQQKAMSDEQYKQQKLEIDRMEAETKRQQALAQTKKEKEPKEAQYNAAGFAKRMEQAEQDLNRVLEKGFDPTAKANLLTSFAPEALKSEGRKSFEQARRNFINAVLRRESGAAISASEFDNANQQYFPVAGDSPEVLQQKAQNRALAMATMKAASGKAYDEVSAGVPQAMLATNQPASRVEQSMRTGGFAVAAPAQRMSPDAVMKAAGIDQKQLDKYAKDNNVSVEKALSVLERRVNGQK